MQNLKSLPEFFGRSVISSGGEVGHFAQPDCGDKPQNNQCSNPPSMIRRAGTQRPSQHQERRDYGDEEENVIQIHRSKLQRPHGIDRRVKALRWTNPFLSCFASLRMKKNASVIQRLNASTL